MERRPPLRADGSAAVYGAAMFLGVGLSFAALGTGAATHAGERAAEARAEAQAFDRQHNHAAGNVAAGYAAASKQEQGYYSFLAGAGVALTLGAGAYWVGLGRRSGLKIAPRQQQRIADS